MSRIALNEKLTFKSIKLNDGTELEGSWTMTRAYGELQQVGYIFLTNGEVVVPITAILSMTI